MNEKPTFPAKEKPIDLPKRVNILLLLIPLTPLVGILTFLSIIAFTDYSLAFINDEADFIPLEFIVIGMLLLTSGFFAIGTGSVIINPDGVVACLLTTALGYNGLFVLAIKLIFD